MTQPMPLPNQEKQPEILPAAGRESPGVVARDPLERAFELPLVLTLEVPVVGFTVGALIGLETGTVVETNAQQNEDLPLTVHGQLVGMVEIEVVGETLAVRLAGVA